MSSFAPWGNAGLDGACSPRSGSAAASLPPQPSLSSSIIMPAQRLRRLPQGEITNAWPHAEDPFAGRRVRRTAQQRAGKAYEARVGKLLFGGSWPGSILRSPWFAYTDASPGVQFCQPDFILDKGRGAEAIVVEVKLRWHPDAWWQLERLYLPVLRHGLPGRELHSLCICGSYDPAVAAPGPVVVVRNLSEANPTQFSVLVIR